ncbi:hypothetical protein WJX77_008953 [Trebouxia sp. C0004]
MVLFKGMRRASTNIVGQRAAQHKLPDMLQRPQNTLKDLQPTLVPLRSSSLYRSGEVLRHSHLQQQQRLLEWIFKHVCYYACCSSSPSQKNRQLLAQFVTSSASSLGTPAVYLGPPVPLGYTVVGVGAGDLVPCAAVAYCSLPGQGLLLQLGVLCAMHKQRRHEASCQPKFFVVSVTND